ncbi:DgyrCDS2603 [Dimorphilus gyrociliatus]|nr:DgyrCDS2603 [Dimorphilus gyrociliatus]
MWLRLDKKISSLDIAKDPCLTFNFRAQFFPEDVAEELIQDITQRLFYLQVKRSILNEDIYSPADVSVLLASYALQAKYGDFHKSISISEDNLLPQSVIDNHKLSREEWEERIITWWKDHTDLLREEAMMEYLKITQDLEMYGVNYFEIKNKKGSDLLLGVDALGLNIYEPNDKLIPRVGFPWSEIRNISFNDKKFIIKPIDKNSPEFVFIAPRLRINKLILSLCMKNHELYLQRRQAESIESQQMRIAALEERRNKKFERQSVKEAKKKIEQIEREKEELRERLSKYEEEMKKAKEDLENSQIVARELELKASTLVAEAEKLAEARRQAEEAARQAEQARSCEKEEYEKLKSEAETRLREIAAMEARESELQEKMESLQIEYNKAQFEVEQSQLRMQEAIEAAPVIEREVTPQTDVAEQTEVPVAIETNGYKEDQVDSVVETVVQEIVNNNIEVAEVQQQQNEIPVKEEEEEEENPADSITNKKKLEALRQELGEKRGNISRNDVIHHNTLLQGLDKYKTLKQIRMGNTKNRIDQFESL